MIINAVQCDLTDFMGKRPQLEDFAQTFMEASKDPRKNRTFELLVVALRRMVGDCVVIVFIRFDFSLKY